MDAATAGIIGSIAGTIIGAFFAWLTAIHVLRTQEQYKYSADFIANFIEIQRLLKIRHPNHSAEYCSTYNLLRDNYKHLFITVLHYKQSLSKRKAKKLEKIWFELCTFDEIHQEPTFKEYMVTDYNHDKEMKIRDLALSRIQELLTLAKLK